ncbi:YibE/F family protein [Jongsikchunia kroppenstedtii]|uniref:YibE/F family protein n=1 Tax=Jongsikchunia kroppenstedtii TaxID=1121721 RepID=UPI000361FA80|nr:YibE/F family protein [Jongsikchunia kroppenstedtii]
MGHPHSHGSTGPVPLSPWVARAVVGVLVAATVAVVIGVVMLWPQNRHHDIPLQFQSATGGPAQLTTGTVTGQTQSDCRTPGAGQATDTPPTITPVPDGPCLSSIVSLTSGPDKGSSVVLQIPTHRAGGGLTPDSGSPEMSQQQLNSPQANQPDLKMGNHIRLVIFPSPTGRNYAFYDFDRGASTIWWIVAFAVAIIAVAAWRGVGSLLGLAFAFAALIWFALPSLLDGHSPVAVALVASAAILIVVIFLAHGVSLRTSAALLGTLVSLGVATGLSQLAVTTMHLSGFSDDNSALQAYQNGISIKGIVLAGFIIGALGVLNDVTVTQASTVFELANMGSSGRWRTFGSAMRVGRDHISSTVYTLMFAYAGAALPLLMLYSVSGQSFSTSATRDTIAIEIARSCVGGIALALSVPLTTGIATLLADHRRPTPTPVHDDHRAATPPPSPSRGRHSLPE